MPDAARAASFGNARHKHEPCEKGQAGHAVQRRAQAELRQPGRCRRTQHQPHGTGRAERGQGAGTPVRWRMVGDQGLADGRDRAIEQTHGAARQHDGQEGQRHRRQHTQRRVDGQAHRGIGHAHAGHAEQQHRTPATSVAGRAPDARHQHPQRAADGDGGAGLPGLQAEHPRHRRDHGHESHHRHRAGHVGEQQRLDVEGRGADRAGAAVESLDKPGRQHIGPRCGYRHGDAWPRCPASP